MAITAVLAAQLALPLVGCAGSIEGEVDGEAVPPLLSGLWLEGDGDGFRVSASAASVLDLCGSMAAITKELATFVEATADEVDEDDDAADVYEDVADHFQELFERHLPEDFWTVSSSILIDDEDDFVDDYDLGEDAELDFESLKLATFTVCHQEGYPDLDDDGTDDNRTCFPAKGGELEVVAFDDQGALELRVEAELAEADDLDDEVGDVTATLRMGGCASLEDASDDLEDAEEDLRDALGAGSGPRPNEGEGEGEGEGELTCTSEAECLDSHLLCDIFFGVCADPSAVTANCAGAAYFATPSGAGPILFAATMQPSSLGYCDLEVSATFSIYDADDDLGYAPTLSVIDNAGRTVEVAEFSLTSSGLATAVLCLSSSDPGVALQLEDQAGNLSNALCASY